jgi:hypothetical protein
MDFHKVRNDSYLDYSSISELIKESDNFTEFDALFNNEFQNIIIADKDANVVSMNKKFIDSLSEIKKANLAIGSPIINIIAPENQKRFTEEFNTALSGQKIISE